MGIGGKIALAFAVLVTTTAAVLGVAGYVTTSRQVTEEIDRFLRQRAEELTSGERESPKKHDDDEPDRPVAAAVQVTGPDSQVQALDREGDVIASSGAVLPVDEQDREIAERREPSRLRTVTVDGVDYRVLTAHVDGGGAIQVARELEEAQSLLDVLRGQLILIALGLAVAAAAVGWFLAQRITRPLRRLTTTVDEVARTQDFTASVDVSGVDEVGRLGSGFNRLLGALDLSRQQQRRLVQDAAHELRTPLTSIRANVDYLAVAADAPVDERREALAGVRRELGELSELIDEIIELAIEDREQPNLVVLDLADVVNQACEQFAARSDRDLRVTVGSSTVMGDSDGLRRAIGNLLSNADKYSPADEPIGVDSGEGRVVVSDSGPGVAPPEREVIFDRFYRSDSARAAPGSGLGLAIVQSIVAAHGGTVSVGESTGGGAAFTIALPLAEQRAAATAPTRDDS